MEKEKVLTIKRFPRTTSALLSVTEDSDASWAAGIISAAKSQKSPLSLELVREAFHKRKNYRSKEASRIVKEIIEEKAA